MLRFLTAGESHGQALVVVIDGVPAGLRLDGSTIGADLSRRQLGYGRGRRMAIERDAAEILAGVRRGETIGSPLALLIRNRDWPNWEHTMSVEAEPSDSLGGARRPPVTRPRPGHADLAAGLKYGRDDLRDVLERASARETAARVAAGAVARAILARCSIEVSSHVIGIGGVRVPDPMALSFEDIRALSDTDDIRCVDPAIASDMRTAIDAAREAGDTVGGSFEVMARGVPPGLGSHVQWDRKLDGRLAQALASIPAIKAVGFGLAAAVGDLPGSAVHDAIHPATPETRGQIPGISRPTNRAGGLEGGVTNGEDIRVTAWMKPISTLMKPLRSVDLATMREAAATVERSDVCAVPAAAVVGEAMVALVLADALLETFGGDRIEDLEAAWRRFRRSLESRLTPSSEPA
jgi:chorismate synthase